MPQAKTYCMKRNNEPDQCVFVSALNRNSTEFRISMDWTNTYRTLLHPRPFNTSELLGPES